MESRDVNKSLNINEDYDLRIRHSDHNFGTETFEALRTRNGVTVPHPGRYHILRKDPEDFMSDENRLKYFAALVEFTERGDRSHDGLPNHAEYMTSDELARFEEHLRVRLSQRARYWSLKAEAWQNWLLSQGIAFRIERLANGCPIVIPLKHIKRDPAFEEIESWENQVLEMEEHDWTALKESRGWVRA